jgi:hypothetical protein
LAKEVGVEFSAQAIDPFSPPPGQLVLASGLTSDMYAQLGIPSKAFYGYYYRRTAKPDVILLREFPILECRVTWQTMFRGWVGKIVIKDCENNLSF